MKIKMLARSAPLALALALAPAISVASAPASFAAVSHAAMTVTKTGKITKIDSKTSFTITVDMKNYLVTTNDMTKVKIDSMSAKVSALKKGDAVTVKGSLDMDTIAATSIVKGM